MYTLLTGLYAMFNRKEDFFVIILGLDNAGKSTLLERIKATYSSPDAAVPASKIAPTVGLNIGKIDLGSTCINFWDLGGQRELRRLWKKYYSESHAIVFVVDATDLERIEEARDVFETIVGSEEFEGVPVLLLANKSDRDDAVELSRLKDVFNPVAARLGARDSRVMSVSALRGEGVRDAVDWLAIRLERNRVNRPPVLRPL
ncbi:ADP-ribosylation factor protein 3 [Entophlyctis sp. JEL0112]|nr:ADP-ribosylation factor protein 3 [Entophlyctis sp. JEL0112]